MSLHAMRIDGLPITDANKPIVIRITAGDVRRGSKKDPGGCAAALACMRKFHAAAVRVHKKRTFVKLGRHWVRYMTSDSLRSEIVAFDRGGSFEPGLYTLTPPRRRVPKNGKHQGGQEVNGARNKRRKPHITTNVRVYGAAR